ncbi:MAG: hypothetical protein AUJ75_02855 [Candidatus Omnitrophica bacterium CG1_02_49_10]|nr:MAG: hypothetical protein AUJ75_02855 [Candidatus Omnitrophica bacterium CG1_02_49_10]
MTAKRNNGDKESAFSLVEVMVAMLILSLAVGGFFAAFVMQARFSIQPEHKTLGMNFVQQTLEGLRNAVSTYYSTGQHGAPLIAGDHVPGVTLKGLPADSTIKYTVVDRDLDADWDSDGLDTDNNADTPQTGDDIDVKQVRIIVTWSEE